MAKPIVVDQRKKLTLEIRRGPGLHLIEHIICSPSDHWFDRGVDFITFIPYNEIDGRKSGTEFPISLIPISLRRLSMYAEDFAFGCHFPEDLDDATSDFLLKNNPPVRITNYSTQNRVGTMEVSYEVYCRFINMLSRSQY